MIAFHTPYVVPLTSLLPPPPHSQPLSHYPLPFHYFSLFPELRSIVRSGGRAACREDEDVCRDLSKRIGRVRRSFGSKFSQRGELICLLFSLLFPAFFSPSPSSHRLLSDSSSHILSSSFSFTTHCHRVTINGIRSVSISQLTSKPLLPTSFPVPPPPPSLRLLPLRTRLDLRRLRRHSLLFVKRSR